MREARETARGMRRVGQRRRKWGMETGGKETEAANETRSDTETV